MCFGGDLQRDFEEPPLVVTNANRFRLWKVGPPFVELANSDQDGDLSDVDHLPVPGLLFELLARDTATGDPTGPVLKTSTSGDNGAYRFDGVAPGAYITSTCATRSETSGDGAAWAEAASYVPLGTGLGFRREPAPGGQTAPGGGTVLLYRHTIAETLAILPGGRLFLGLRVTSSG